MRRKRSSRSNGTAAGRISWARRLGLIGVPALALLGLTAWAMRPGREPERLAVVPTAGQPGGASPMVWIPGGRFWRGSDQVPDARPVAEVEVDGFWMDRTEVTNAQFAAFVQGTGYVTVAERSPDPKLFPGAPPERLVPGSAVFDPPAGPVDLGRPLSWWRYAPGADWRHPEGPGSTIEGRDDSPVRTRSTTASGRPRQSLRFRPMASAFTTWPAMSGSGAPTGTGPTPMPRPPREIRPAPTPRSTRTSRAFQSGSSVAGRSCVATSTADAIGPIHGARGRPTAPPGMSGSAASARPRPTRRPRRLRPAPRPPRP